LNFKITIRVSEDPCGAFLKADNRFFAAVVTLTKFLTYNFADRIITNAIKSQNCVRKFLIKKKKVILLYNPTLKRILKKNNIKKKNYILNVGRLCKQKNQFTILNAFSIFVQNNKDYELFFCGDGPDKKKLQMLVQKLNLIKK
jgi:glycosyltransferase involved in cell wall biosynthesis